MGDPKELFKAILQDGVRKIAPQATIKDILVERPKNPDHGDLSTNVALLLSKQVGRKPHEIAQQLKDATLPALVASGLTTQAGASIAGPGFYNIHVSPTFKLRAIRRALDEGVNFGTVKRTDGHLNSSHTIISYDWSS